MLPRGRRDRRAAERRRHRRRRRRGARRRSPTARRSSCSAATCRWSPPRRSRELVAAHAAAGARGDDGRRAVLDDPSGLRPRRARRGRAASSASSRPRPPGDATAEELAIREVNTGIYAFDGGAAARRAAAASAPTTPRASATCPTCCRCCAPTARTVAAHVVDDPPLRARRQRPRRPRAGPRDRPAADHRRSTCAPASTIVDPASTIDRRRRRRSAPDTVDRAGRRPARRDARRRGLPHRPADDARRRRRRRRRDRPARLPRSTARCATASASARSPTCARAPCCASGSKVGTFVEIKNSDIGEGTKVPHLSLHRRRRRRRRARTSAPARSPPTTTAATSTARRSAPACAAASHTSFVAPVTRRRRRLDRAPASVITEDVPPGALGVARAAPAQHRGLRRAPRRRRPSDERRRDRRPHRTLRGADWPQPRAEMATSLPIDYDKRLMLFSGRANPELAAQIAEQARRRPRPGHAQDLLQRRGLLPLRGVDPRRRRLHRPADVRQPGHRHHRRTTR